MGGSQAADGEQVLKPQVQGVLQNVSSCRVLSEFLPMGEIRF
jgi:hypothetical protein